MTLDQCGTRNTECGKKRSGFRSAFRVLHSAWTLLILASPSAAESLQTPRFGQRTDAFRRLLSEFQFTPVNAADKLLAEPNKSILIVLGNPSCLSRRNFPEGLQRFVQQGGAVLIATDMETGGEPGQFLNQLAGVRVTGEKLLAPARADLYENQLFCPFVQPLAAETALGGSSSVLDVLAAVVGAGGRPELFRNPQPNQKDLRVATNAPSRLQEVGFGELPGGIQHWRNCLPAVRTRTFIFAP